MYTCGLIDTQLLVLLNIHGEIDLVLRSELIIKQSKIAIDAKNGKTYTPSGLPKERGSSNERLSKATRE